ncbi:CHAT domain-containing protein [Micromonospora haikouensis]|uniref:CHAT domain-containing protein n=1 Tax=Micromonospora haikouensis TaxID=686309 RepID=UPI0036C074DD
MPDDTWTLRWVAAQARTRLGELVADAEAAARIDKLLAEALARPPGVLADLALARALRGDPALERWAMETLRAAESRFRAEPGSAPPVRYLTTSLPHQARLGTRFPLHVTISRDGGPGSVPTRPFPVPERGVDVLVTVASPTLSIESDAVHVVRVHPGDDPDGVVFVLGAAEEGRHEVTVRAFLDGGGSQIAAMVRTVLVTDSASYAPPHRLTARVEHLTPRPDEVALQVDRHRDGYAFRLVGRDGPTATAESVPRGLLADLLRTVNAAARGTGGRPAAVRGELAGYGTLLWRALPPEIGREVEARLATATGLTICSDVSELPWELLLPPTWDEFPAERLAVMRQTGGHSPARSLALTDAVFVHGRNPPTGAVAEIREVNAGLDTPGALVTSTEELLRRIERGDFGLLHLACHQDQPGADSDGGVAMDDGRFRPVALARAAARGSLRARCPLVFFNACRSVDGGSYDTLMGGWANEFVRAGAGAFVGSTWAVRTDSAHRYADRFYAELRGGAPLAAASFAARRELLADPGDPTGLAYAVYGDPQATVLTGATA